MAHLSGFAPVGSSEPRILILGSFPSEASLDRLEYYGHERNQFWTILGSILGFQVDEAYEGRVSALSRAGIALWDVIASCEREGSLDQAIRGESVNPIADFVAARQGIARLGLNGGKAFSSFARHFAPELKHGGLAIGERALWRPPSRPDRPIVLARLPSTSPVPTQRYRHASDKLPAWASFLE